MEPSLMVFTRNTSLPLKPVTIIRLRSRPKIPTMTALIRLGGWTPLSHNFAAIRDGGWREMLR